MLPAFQAYTNVFFDCLVAPWPIPEEEEAVVEAALAEERVARASSWSNATTADRLNLLIFESVFDLKLNSITLKHKIQLTII